jgi:hypothetical protein
MKAAFQSGVLAAALADSGADIDKTTAFSPGKGVTVIRGIKTDKK